MWEKSAKSWGKGEEASDEALSSEAQSIQKGVLCSCSGGQAWKNLFQRTRMQNIYESSREDMVKVSEETSIQFYK